MIILQDAGRLKFRHSWKLHNFFPPVKQQGQTVYAAIGTLFLAALHKMQLAGWQFCTAPRGTAGDLIKKTCFYQALQRKRAALMATEATYHVFFKDYKNRSIL